jgi:hypothetical protein
MNPSLYYSLCRFTSLRRSIRAVGGNAGPAAVSRRGWLTIRGAATIELRIAAPHPIRSGVSLAASVGDVLGDAARDRAPIQDARDSLTHATFGTLRIARAAARVRKERANRLTGG